MATQTNQQRAQQPTQQQQPAYDPAKLLEEVLAQTITAKYRVLEGALEKRIDKIEELLPEHMKGQAARFVKRAMLTFDRNPTLQKCTEKSIIRCILEAAELGLAIDGRLGHAVPFNTKVKDADGKERWEHIATFIPDYKGIIAVARRTRIIKDVYARIVCANDDFIHGEKGGECYLEHTYPLGEPRGEVDGAYAIVKLHDGTWRYELMDVEDLNRIRSRSKSFQGGYSSPWKTDEQEMQKKGLAVDTPVPTPSGWTTMGELEIGDLVFDGNGNPARVCDVSEVKNIECYRITFSNHDSIVCDNEHRWPASVGKNGSCYRKLHGWAVHSVAQLYDAKRSGQIISVPIVESLNIDHRHADVDPWLLGYWLGNGHSGAACVTCHEDDHEEVIDRISSTPYTVGAVRKDPRSKAVTVRIRDGFLLALRALGLIGNKHVPREYLRFNETARRALLCGLMDSDGCMEKVRGTAIFENTNLDLSDAVAELATSVGEVVNRHSKTCHGYGTVTRSHRVCWQPTAPPVTLSRKAERFRPRKLAPYRGIASIEKVPSVPTKCIAVESETHTYLAGRSMIVTHNTVIKRCLKTYADDPGIIRMLEMDDRDTEDVAEPAADTLPTGRTSHKPNGDTPRNRISEPEAIPEPPTTAAPTEPAEPQGQTSPEAEVSHPVTNGRAEPAEGQSDSDTGPSPEESWADDWSQRVDAEHGPDDMRSLAVELLRNKDQIGKDVYDKLLMRLPKWARNDKKVLEMVGAK